MQKSPKRANIKAKPTEITAEYAKAIESKLNDGYLVELMRLRDGTIQARSVRKKEILIPDA